VTPPDRRAAAQSMCPRCQRGKCDRIVHDDDEVVPKPRIERAELGLAPLDKEPRCLTFAPVLELEPNEDTMLRQHLATQVDLTPRLEDHPRVRVVGPDLHPLITSSPAHR